MGLYSPVGMLIAAVAGVHAASLWFGAAYKRPDMG